MANLTPRELRAEAARLDQAAEESFQRCDTDGFLSQWAARLNAELARTRADIAENDGMWGFEALFEGERRVDARHIPTQFGSAWLLSDDEAERFGRRFVPFAGHGGKSRVQKDLGLHEDMEQAPAAAKITGRGTGLSGNAWVEVFRTDGR